MTDTQLRSPGMLNVLKIAAALVGIAMFGVGIRIESNTVRWVGIACVGVAWLLRFARRQDGTGAVDASASPSAGDPGAPQPPDDTK
ncbi:MAG: hypothetical protein FJ202_05415 [Gemmatimonadetes bacterium]|nr:hypothetical protein [Gemmatimonadota bacterium]